MLLKIKEEYKTKISNLLSEVYKCLEGDSEIKHIKEKLKEALLLSKSAGYNGSIELEVKGRIKPINIDGEKSLMVDIKRHLEKAMDSIYFNDIHSVANNIKIVLALIEKLEKRRVLESGC